MREIKSISSLHNHPDLALRVGLIIADYACIEYQVFVIYAVMSDKNPSESFRAFYQYISAHNKVGLVLRQADGNLDGDKRRGLDRLLTRFQHASKRRTEIAHCVFLSDKDGSLLRLRFANGNPAFEPFNDSIFTRTIDQYHTLSTDLSAFLAILVPSRKALLHTLHALPRAPSLETLVGPAVPGLQMQLEKDQLIASLERQKLLHLLPVESR